MLAGATYWFWSEMYEFDRAAPACTEGILREALVDAERNPLPDYAIFRDAFAALYQPEKDPDWELKIATLPCDLAGKCYQTVRVSALLDEESRTAAWEKMITDSKVHNPRYHSPNKGTRKMYSGPILNEDIVAAGALPLELVRTPYVVDGTLTVPVDLAAKGLWVIGNVSMPKGYPIAGTYGEDVVEYAVTYTDGTVEHHMMKNGEDVTTAAALHGPSRIEPYAENAPRLARFRHQIAWEHYVMNARYIPTDPTKTVKALVLKNAGNGYLPLFYGLTAEI